MGKHTTSMLMLAAAIAYYLIFGLMIPKLVYVNPETASGGLEWSKMGFGFILTKTTPFITLVLVLYAGATFVKELRGKS